MDVISDGSALLRVRARLNRLPVLGDALLAATLAAVAAVEIGLQAEPDAMQGYAPPAAGLIVLATLWMTVPLVGRRRFPLTTGLLVVVVSVFSYGGAYSAPLCICVVLYSVTVYGGRGRLPVLALCCLTVAQLPVWFWVNASGASATDQFSNYQSSMTIGLVLVLPVALGAAIRRLRQGRDELRLRVQQLQEERAENARKVLFEERVRIARELHDVVSHHVSVMGVQAGAARMMTRTLAETPPQLAVALGAIESSSRRAIAELHQLLGFLRREGEPADPAPQPGLDRLDELVAQVERSRLEVQGVPRPVDRTVDVSAYRIVQEALTNSVKHSGGAASTVVIRYRPVALEVEVVDHGKGPPAVKATDHVGGHGLIGMRERVAQHGGQLRVGPRPNGGFGVHAVFPLDA